MTLYIYRNGQQGGPYSIDHVSAWLSSGQVQPTDLACYTGGTAWVPLHTLPELSGQHQSGQPMGQPGGGHGGAWPLIIIGAILTTFGALLCVTLIGAIIGIPLLIIGLPMVIYGRIKYNRSVMEGMKESVRIGIMQGMQAQQPPTSQLSWQNPPTPAQQSGPLPSQPAAACHVCGEILLQGSTSCSKCAAVANVAPEAV
jgi:hypothetical protein